jgi:hypothetical protein
MTTLEQSDVQTAGTLPWGQLIVGSVVGGLALWIVALNVFGVAPSAMLAGVASIYEAARDTATAPPRWLQIDLSPNAKDGLAFLLVMFAAMIRTARRYPDYWWVPAFLIYSTTLWVAISETPTLSWETVPTRTEVAEAWIKWGTIHTLFLTVALPISGFLGRVWEPSSSGLDEMTAPPMLFTLWNAILIAVVAAFLLLLNWATL